MSPSLDQFRITDVVTYKFSPDGELVVLHDIAITNATSTAFVTTYSQDLLEVGPTGITARDTKNLPVSVMPSGPNSTRVEVSRFTSPAVGLGKTQRFTLAYSAASPATHSGQVWEIFLPRLANPHFFANYQAVVEAPVSWGNPVSSVPHPISHLKKTSVNTQKLTYSHSQITDHDISLVLGNVTSYSFDLRYHLEPGSSPWQSISLPSDSLRQQIHLLSIEPQPDRVSSTELGSWQAHYQVPARQTVAVSGVANILNLPVNAKPDIFASPSATAILPNLQTMTPVAYQDFPEPKVKTTVVIPTQLFPVFSNTGELILTNSTGVSARSPDLPPFATQRLPLKLPAFPAFSFSPQSFSLSVGTDHITYNIPATAYLMWQVCVIVFTVLTLIALGYAAFKTWSIYLQKRRRSNSVHR